MKKLLSILLILFPISLITGPLIPEIILAILSVYANFQIIKFKEFHYYKNKYSIFFIIFWFFLMVNALFISENNLFSLKTSLFYFRHFIFSISVIYLLDKKIVNIDKIAIWLFATFIVLVIDLLIQYFFGQNLTGYKTVENRNASFFGDELILGSYLIKIFPIILTFFVGEFLKIEKKIYVYGLLLLFIPILFLTGERTATILGILYVITSSFYIINNSKIKIIFIIFSVSVPIIFLTFNSNLQKRFIHDTINYISESNYNNYILSNQNNSNEKKFYIFSKLHHGHYLSAYKLFLEKPITGNGVNSFRLKCKKFSHEYNCSTHPHNITLQILAETGIIGLLFYISVYMYFIYNFLKKNSIYLRLLSLGLLIYLFPFSPAGNFFNNWINMQLYYIIGLYMYLKLYFIQSKNV